MGDDYGGRRDRYRRDSYDRPGPRRAPPHVGPPKHRYGGPPPHSTRGRRSDDRGGWRPPLVPGLEPLPCYGDWLKTQTDDAAPDALWQRYCERRRSYAGEAKQALAKELVAQDWLRDRCCPTERVAAVRRLERRCRDGARAFLDDVREDAARGVELASLAPGGLLAQAAAGTASAAAAAAALKFQFQSFDMGRVMTYRNVPVCMDRISVEAAVSRLVPAAAVAGIYFGPVSRRLADADGGPPKDLRMMYMRDLWIELAPEAAESPEAACHRQALSKLEVPLEVDQQPDPDKFPKGDPAHEEDLRAVPANKMRLAPVTVWILEADSEAAAAARHRYVALPDEMCTPERMAADLETAKELVQELDRVRGIEVSGEDSLTPFAELIEEPLVAAAVAGGPGGAVGAELDLCVAYLRRVHFVAYYGRRSYAIFSDLVATPDAYMHLRYRTEAKGGGTEGDAGEGAGVEGGEGNDAADTEATEAKEAEIDATGDGDADEGKAMDEEEEDVRRRRRRDADEGDAGGGGGGGGGGRNGAENGSGHGLPDGRPRGSSEPFGAVLDAFTTGLLTMLRKPDLRWGVPLSVFEDAEAVEAERTTLSEAWLKRLVCLTQETRARCGRCYKLFQNENFLPKHFRKKHPQECFAVDAQASLKYAREEMDVLERQQLLPAIQMTQGRDLVDVPFDKMLMQNPSAVAPPRLPGVQGLGPGPGMGPPRPPPLGSRGRFAPRGPPMGYGGSMRGGPPPPPHMRGMPPPPPMMGRPPMMGYPLPPPPPPPPTRRGESGGRALTSYESVPEDPSKSLDYGDIAPKKKKRRRA